jgi:hypothetical protein
LRSEAANLLSEIHNLNSKNKELELKLQRTSGEGNTIGHSAGGSSNSKRLASYYQSIDELSAATRNGQSTSVLVAMKAVLLSCKGITEESESIENAGILNESDRVRLHSGKEALSSALAHLLEIAKDHASGGVSLDGLDDAIDRLTQSLNDLVNIMKRYENTNMKDSQISKWASPPDSPTRVSSAARDFKTRGMDLVELKVGHKFLRLRYFLKKKQMKSHILSRISWNLCVHHQHLAMNWKKPFALLLIISMS